MAVGQNALHAGLSYLAVGRETTLGTYNTCTAQLEFFSMSIKTTKERKVLEEIAYDRTYAKDLGLMKIVEGDVESYFKPDQLATAYILQNAFGGTVTSATATGETAGGAAFSHTFAIGQMNQSYPSLCLNTRKGPSSTGRVWQYSGVRVNEYTFTAELEEPLKITQSFVAFDSTQVSNDVQSALSHSASTPCLSFVNGRLSVEASLGSLTSTSFWHVEAFEFKINNSLKGEDSRRIGSDIIQDLPPGMATFELTATIRFDTTTAYDAMIAETELAAEFEFLGDTLGTSVIRRGVNLVFPKITIMDAGDPEIGGADEVLKSEVVFNVLRSEGQSYACQAILTNSRSSYA